MRGIKVTVMMLLVSQAIVAQIKTAEEIVTKKVGKIESALELRENQKAAISNIALSSSTQMLEYKNAGTLDKEARHKLRVEEHKQIHAVLTPEQRIALKESRTHTKEEHIARNRLQQVHQAEVKERKNLLIGKRAAFEDSLTDAEKETIEQARSLMQDGVKGKEAKVALTEEEKRK
ncbi:MAG: ribosomal protein S8 [Bacteroidia bacterium]|jgi:ribosomal protein S8